MWADAQRDRRPAEYRWRPLQKFGNSIPCNVHEAAKFAVRLTPAVECRAVTLPI